jgi:chaperone modulatory protein CbpM
LIRYIDAQIVRPEQSDSGYIFQSIDIARLQLLCDLSDDLDLDETALAVVISLLDQLHAARQDLHALANALQVESAEIRQRIGLALVRG